MTLDELLETLQMGAKLSRAQMGEYEFGNRVYAFELGQAIAFESAAKIVEVYIKHNDEYERGYEDGLEAPRKP